MPLPPGENDVTYLYVKDEPIFLEDSLYNTYFSVKHAMSAASLLCECRAV